MASIYKRRKTWCISYFLNGKRCVKSLKTTDEKFARFLKKEHEVQIKKGTLRAERQKSIEAYLPEYLQTTTHRKWSTNTASFSRIKAFMQCHGKKTINGINQDDIYEFLKLFENHSSKTFNNLVGELRRFFQPAVEKGYILKNPVIGIRLKRLAQSLPRFLTDEEYSIIERLAEGNPIYPMIVTARYTGLRLQELLHLEWQDFDWERKLVRVLNKPKFGHTVKNFQIRVVPIGEQLKDKLLPYIKTEGLCFPTPMDGPYNREGPRRLLNWVLDRSNLREGKRMLGYHSFRHTFASRLAQEGVSLYKICKWLGHADMKTTQIYAHFAPIYDGDIEKLSIHNNQNPSVPTSATL